MVTSLDERKKAMYSVTKQIPYAYKNCPIPGGGYVTGFVFHPVNDRILYARTDIGGVYRFDFDGMKWQPLCDGVTAEHPAQTFPLSIAVCEDDDSVLLMACGTKHENYLSVSFDRGNTFTDKPLPCSVHGNEAGRSTGERLLYKDGVIWFASQTAGLFRSCDMGDSWESVSVNGEKNLTFIWISPDSSAMLAGTNGEVNSPDGKRRGCTLYCSYDMGKSFSPLFTPDGYDCGECDYTGFVPQKAAFDGQYIYVTYCQSGKIVWGGMGAYSCDTGTAYDGRVFRYKFSVGRIEFDKDITPTDPDTHMDKPRKIKGAYCAAECSGGVVYISTICRQFDDIIYRSSDCGESWEKILFALKTGEVSWTVPYMKPQYNGGGSCIHWISDFKVSPHNKSFAVFNTGTGAFFTENLTDNTVRFSPLCDGLEETVHLNVYSPSQGDVQVIDIVGDLGGFAFTDVDKPCENSFADENGNRYITCLNADFTDHHPYYVIATPRGNWTGKTKGGLILSRDQCKSWERLGYPVGISENTDAAVSEIQKPNVNSGWAALSADGKRILWTLSFRNIFRSDMTVFTDDEGKSWRRSVFLDSAGSVIDTPFHVKVFADRTDSDVFYGFTFDNRLFASIDKGESFRPVPTDGKITSYPNDIHDRREIRCQPLKTGVIWLANGIDGLYFLEFDKQSFTCHVKNLLSGGDYSRCIGFGKGENAAVTLYTVGRICGKYGFYRSSDYGESWEKINSNGQCFGGISSVSGDPRRKGRIYLATTSRGLIYGDEIE